MDRETVTEAETAPARGRGSDRRITEAYARLVARDTYLWAWTMANVYNRRSGYRSLKQAGRLGGGLPAAPPNHICMLTDYIKPSVRDLACPSHDVVYGAGPLALEVGPVIVQVPDFGDRFWVYQIVDLRTDSFADLGKMYDSRPGFYLLVGPEWRGEAPWGMRQIFKSKTNTGFICARVFLDDTDEDRQAIQPLISQIDVYPVTQFDGTMKRRDWSAVPDLPIPGAAGAGEWPKVHPQWFFDELPRLLKDAPPLPNEEVRYTEAMALVDAARRDPKLRAIIIDEAFQADEELVEPLRQFRSFGISLPHHWSTTHNGASFGTDCFTRTAIARSNIFVNKPNEAKYFYQDSDASGGRLNGSHKYRVTFGRDQPPVYGFWSLTLYNAQHFFAPNDINRFSIGTKNKGLIRNVDGSVTIDIQADPPSDPARYANWLPAPIEEDFSLFIRAYWPAPAITAGRWAPPPVERDQ
jgi:hypothetical protein